MATDTERRDKTLEWHSEPRPIRRMIRRVKADDGRRALFGRDRRAQRRTPLRRTVYLLPVTLDGSSIHLPGGAARHTIGYTTNVTPRGIGFTHDEPLLSRYVVATFDLVDAEPVSLLVQVQWSRCRADRWYASGGKIIGVTETPSILAYNPLSGTALFN